MGNYDLIPQDIKSINPVTFDVEDDGVTLKGCSVGCEVNYGARGLPETIELWDKLDDAGKQKVQEAYDLFKSKVEQIILGI